MSQYSRAYVLLQKKLDYALKILEDNNEMNLVENVVRGQELF